MQESRYEIVHAWILSKGKETRSSEKDFTKYSTDAQATLYYQHLVHRIDSELPVTLKHQIEIDIPRTFPQTKTSLSSESGRSVLRRVLSAYAIRNRVLGYCQVCPNLV